MKLLKNIYNTLTHQITPPKTFGSFHLVAIGVIGFMTTLVCKKLKNASERSERRLALGVWIGLVVLELYKQLVCSFTLENDAFVFAYDWHSFPFQFCSAPLYVLPLIAFLKNGKLREAIVAFFSTYTLVAGLIVCIYPGNVFVETLGIDIQSLVWHGSQVALGILFGLRRLAKEDAPNRKRFFLSAVPIFLIFVAVATVLNLFVYNAFSLKELDETFNMFFISPYFETMIPILSIVQKVAPFPIFLLSYVLGFSALTYLVLVIETLTIRLIRAKNTES